MDRIKKAFGIERMKTWYEKYERPISSFALVGGFIFDALTIGRIDRVWDNLWVLGHIVIVSVFIVLAHSKGIEEQDTADSVRKHFWYVNILQFFFGGMLSVFLIIYFRSSDLSVSWPFILILVVAFWANESLKQHFVRLTFRISFFFLALMSCSIFLVPVLIHKIGGGVFILSGIISLVLIFLFLYVLAYFNKGRYLKSQKMIFLSIACIFITMNVLYFTNLIPPIPLSLKDAGIYHMIRKESNNSYTVAYEDHGWASLFQLYDDVYISSGESLYAYSAVFSPTNLNLEIVHRWQHYDEATKKWVEAGRVVLPLRGGRSEGFRTYSLKRNVSVGKWKVRVETVGGQSLGTMRFNVVETFAPPVLATKILK